MAKKEKTKPIFDLDYYLDEEEQILIKEYEQKLKTAVPFDPTAWALTGKNIQRLVIRNKKYKENTIISFGDMFEQEERLENFEGVFLKVDGVWEDIGYRLEVHDQQIPKYDQFTGKPLVQYVIVPIWLTTIRLKPAEERLKEKSFKGTTEFKSVDNFLTILEAKSRETEEKLKEEVWERHDEGYSIVLNFETGERIIGADSIITEINTSLGLSYDKSLPEEYEYLMI